MNRVRGWFLIAVLLLGTGGPAQAEISIIAPGFTELILPQGGGHYQVLLLEAAFRAGVSFEERVLPQKRAYEEFIHGDADCIYNYTAEALQRLGEDAIIASFPLNPFRLYIFTARDAPALRGPQDLRGKVVGGVLGHADMYASVLPEGVRIEYVSSDRSNIAKLNAGRVDAILGFLPDLAHFTYRLNFDPDAMLFERFDRLTCKAGAEQRVFLRKVSDQLQDMHRDGTMARIMGVHALRFEWEDDGLMP